MYSVVLIAALATQPSTPAWCHGCHGCCGWGGYGCCSCYGCGCWGCYGGCHGCCGWYGGYHGCYGCYGGCYSSCYSYGCYGGCYSCGYYGYTAAYPVYYGSAAPVTASPTTAVVRTEPSANTAKLVVDLPADAKLFIDDQPMKASADRRTFTTPKLEPGATYYYDLRAEMVRDGKPLVEKKRVTVKAGETTTANFTELANAAKADKVEAAAAR